MRELVFGACLPSRIRRRNEDKDEQTKKKTEKNASGKIHHLHYSVHRLNCATTTHTHMYRLYSIVPIRRIEKMLIVAKNMTERSELKLRKLERKKLQT